MRKTVKTVYLVGPIEHSANPDSDWRYKLEKKLNEIGVECINPVRVSYLVDKEAGIEGNARYAAKLKKARQWPEFRAFMKKIWGQNKHSVDDADILVCRVGSQREIRELNASGGTFRELGRGAKKGKKLFLVCPVSLAKANSHMLDVILGSGAIFRNDEQLIAHLKYLNGRRR